MTRYVCPVDAIELAEEARKRGGFLKRNGVLVIPVSSAALNILLIVRFANWCLKKKRKRKVKKKLIEGILSTPMSNKLDESSQTSDRTNLDEVIWPSIQGPAEDYLRSSGQGIEELLGCCIEGDEPMLIYEYLPDKSLDYFIFGNARF
ncbi:S-locus lectin protein kinase family protein [Euphorbia peplus]|nr:S-locus lectin protein kinase family protein [Euphorbia peplus]